MNLTQRIVKICATVFLSTWALVWSSMTSHVLSNLSHIKNYHLFRHRLCHIVYFRDVMGWILWPIIHGLFLSDLDLISPLNITSYHGSISTLQSDETLNYLFYIKRNEITWSAIGVTWRARWHTGTDHRWINALFSILDLITWLPITILEKI